MDGGSGIHPGSAVNESKGIGAVTRRVVGHAAPRKGPVAVVSLALFHFPYPCAIITPVMGGGEWVGGNHGEGEGKIMESSRGDLRRENIFRASGEKCYCIEEYPTTNI